MPAGEERSAEARQSAECALVWLLDQLRDQDLALIVLGGLVPEILTAGQEPPVPAHLGTTDVDVLLITSVEANRDLVPVERALRAMKFEPREQGWRWSGTVAQRPVRIEFLCDLADYRENEIIRPPGCERLGAANLRGTGYVAEDWEWQQVSATLPDGRTVRLPARFASLQGYLLSKCVAVRTRAATKDYYDFPYVLIHNREGGPREAAALLRGGKLASALPALSSTFLEVRERYRLPNDVGPRAYASQMQLVDATAAENELRAGAVGAVNEFFEALRL